MTTTEQRRLIAAHQQRLDAHHARVPDPKPTAPPLPARALRGGAANLPRARRRCRMTKPKRDPARAARRLRAADMRRAAKLDAATRQEARDEAISPAIQRNAVLDASGAVLRGYRFTSHPETT